VPTGQRRIDTDLGPVLYKAWSGGFTVQSDFARKNAGLVAMAASAQLLTTRVTEGVYSSNWWITPKGIRYLNELDLIEEDDNDG
jgi:hypothetical protein